MERNNSRVQVLNSDLTFSSTFGKPGIIGEGRFYLPESIAIDNTGKVYVSYPPTNSIQVFTAEGRFLRMFGRHGHWHGDCNFMWPSFFAIDTNNLVYICESSFHHVSVYTSEGCFVERKGQGPGEFNSPRGIAVDHSGVASVCL